jgi:3,4-dihydroxy-2-butanone 4-phosphate synthase
MAADAATPEAIAFFVRHTSGVICVGLTGERCDELELEPMVREATPSRTARRSPSPSTSRQGTSTGISASTAPPRSRRSPIPRRPEDLNRPGHIFPLRARPGGVLKRAGHTEAAVDLARLAGRYPAGVLCEIVLDDGDMARVPDLRASPTSTGCSCRSPTSIRYRRRHEKLVHRVAEARMPTEWGEFRCYAYESALDGETHLAFVLGDVAGDEPCSCGCTASASPATCSAACVRLRLAAARGHAAQIAEAGRGRRRVPARPRGPGHRHQPQAARLRTPGTRATTPSTPTSNSACPSTAASTASAPRSSPTSASRPAAAHQQPDQVRRLEGSA